MQTRSAFCSSVHSDAAANFRTPVEGTSRDWREWANELHAIYSFNKTKGISPEETLDVMPLGYRPQETLQDTVSTINLPPASHPVCHLEIENRCLMAVLHPTVYPKDAAEAGISGEVVAKGIIAADGSVASIRLPQRALTSEAGVTMLALQTIAKT